MSSITQKDLITAPSSKIVYNAPFSEKNVYNVLVNFQGTRRIGWAIKTTNAKRLNVHPPCGVLDPRENIMLKVTQDQFDYGSEDTNNDRITIEFTEAPAGASKEFRREWFQGDGAVFRKNLPIEYNV